MEKYYNVSWKVIDWDDCDPYNKGYGKKTITKTVRTRKEFVEALAQYKNSNDKVGEISITEVKIKNVSQKQMKFK